jgi:hypothetical protein
MCCAYTLEYLGIGVGDSHDKLGINSHITITLSDLHMLHVAYLTGLGCIEEVGIIKTQICNLVYYIIHLNLDVITNFAALSSSIGVSKILSLLKTRK